MTQKRLTLGRFGNPIYLGNTSWCKCLSGVIHHLRLGPLLFQNDIYRGVYGFPAK
jgi:hypothetical protein